MDLYINKIFHFTINKILILFNYSINSNIIYYIKITSKHSKDWESIKNYFIITLNKLSKTEDKNIFKVENQITLFKYNYGKT